MTFLENRALSEACLYGVVNFLTLIRLLATLAVYGSIIIRVLQASVIGRDMYPVIIMFVCVSRDTGPLVAIPRFPSIFRAHLVLVVLIIANSVGSAPYVVVAHTCLCILKEQRAKMTVSCAKQVSGSTSTLIVWFIFFFCSPLDL